MTRELGSLIVASNQLLGEVDQAGQGRAPNAWLHAPVPPHEEAWSITGNGTPTS